MTTVDDNLLAATLRTAKSGSKAAAKHLDMDAAKHRSAFENAFTDAGKKQQPSIAIDDKTTTDSTPRANIAIAQKLTAGVVKTTTSANETTDIKSTTQTQTKVEVEKKAKVEAETKAEVRAEAQAEAREKVEDRLEADAEANADARATRETETRSTSNADSAATDVLDDAPIDVKSIYTDPVKTPEKPSTDDAAEDTPVLHGKEAEEESVAGPVRPASKTLPAANDISASSALSTLSVLTNADPDPDAEPLSIVEVKPEFKVSADSDPRPAPALPKLETKGSELPLAAPQRSAASPVVAATGKADVPVTQKVADLAAKPAVVSEKMTEAKATGAKTEALKTVDIKESGFKTQDLKPLQMDPVPLTQSADDAAPVASVSAAPSTTAAATDVSHLLTLLSTGPQPVVDNTAVKVESTSVMSEFHALADRAGTASSVPREERGANSETRDNAVPATDKVSSGTEKAAASPDAGAANKTVSADTDQIFRFARSDGKAQAVSMNVGSDVDKMAIKNDIPVVGAKAETVTVVEARRYLGLAPSSNAAAVTSQIVSNPEWAKTLQPADVGATSSAQASTGKVLNTLKIQMHPIDLGTVTATLRLKEDELHVELKVETGGAFRQLSDDQNDIVKSLRSQGFAVDQVNIVFNAPDSSGSTTQQQAQPQTAQQGREALADGSPQGRGQRNDNGSQQQSSGRWTGNEGTSDPSSGADASRTGDVYI